MFEGVDVGFLADAAPGLASAAESAASSTSSLPSFVTDWLPQAGAGWTPSVDPSAFTSSPAADMSWWGSVKDAASSVAGGAKDALGTIGSVAKTVAPLVGLGLTGMNIAANQRAGDQLARSTKIAERAGQRQDNLSREAQNIAAPVTKFSSEQLAMAARGEIPPWLQTELDMLVQAEKAKLNDFYARSGQGDSDAIQKALADVDRKALVAKGKLLQGIQQGGVSAAQTAGNIVGTAWQAAGGAANTAQTQQQDLTKLISQATGALAQMGGATA